MRKNVISFVLFLTALFTNAVFGQVTIGTLMEPDESAALDVNPENPLGVLIPRMSEAERDGITNPAHGLLIFNTDENCVNYYDAESNEWHSLCGGVPNAAVTVDCGSSTVHGFFMQNVPTHGGNYLSIPVQVTKTGMYTLTATPNPANGYYFTVSGSFPNTGSYIVNIPANGTPVNANPSGDLISLIFNGTELACQGLTVPVSPAEPDYTITNVSVVPAQFLVDTPLDPENYYLTVTLSVKTLGEWILVSNAVNGYEFGARGDISQASGYNPNGTFPQTVTVTVPVMGMVNSYGTGSDQFILSNSGSKTPSSYPFTVPLANVGFIVNCTNASISGDPFVQKQDLTNQEITLPITVTVPGTTTITVSGAGMVFTSGEVALAVGNTNIILSPQTTSGPLIAGNQQMVISSSGGGIASSCNIPVYIEPATANITGINLVSVSNNGNYIIDVNGNQIPSVTLSVYADRAGEFLLETQEINGVKFSASGELIASAGAQTVVLQASGEPVDVVGTKTYTVTHGSLPPVHFDINFVYRAMKILIIGAGGYNLSAVNTHIQTSSTGNTTSNADMNFGINGAVPTAGITLTSITGAAAGTLNTQLNVNNYDIVLAGYNNNTYNANDVTAAQNYVRSNGVLFLATEGYANATGTFNNSVRAILADLFDLSNISYGNTLGSGANLGYSAASGQGMYRTGADAGDPILNGPFGNITGKYLGDDVAPTSNVLFGTLPAMAIPLASPLSTTTNLPAGITPSNSWYAVRHGSLGFVWAGDAGFWGTGPDRSAGGTGVAGPVNRVNPLLQQGWTGSGGVTGQQYVFNGQFVMNFIGYAIKYAATNAHP